jgi:phosphatidate cytidylyltransferase
MAEPAKSNSMLSRIVVGTILGVLIVITTFGPTFLLLIFIGAWVTIATIELLRILRVKGINLNPYLTIILNLLLFIFIFFNLSKAIYLLPILAIFIAGLLTQNNRSSIFIYGTFVYFYLGFLPAHLLLLKQLSITANFTTWLVLFPLFLTWVNDTGALLVGIGIGRNQLSPEISKNKTIEGFVGGVLFSAVFAYAYLEKFLPNQPSIIFPILGAIMGFLAQIGDLVESVFKREASLKDSSTLLLAHGGFLDRIDSLLFTIPVFYYYLYFILKS